MRYAFIDQHRQHYPVTRLCRLVEVSRSGYHAWRQRLPSARAKRDAQLITEIRRVHVEFRQAYGYVKTWRTLQSRGIACGKHRVARLRREHGIEPKRVKRQRTTVEHHKMEGAAPDLLQRHFTVDQPNRVWAGDMTFIRTREGWLHLAVMLDLYSRKVVGYATDSRPGQAVHLGALQMAIKARRPEAGLIHHTDRGPQYRSGAYKEVLASSGIQASMNGRKVPQDNAVAESFFSTLKNELIHHVDLGSRAQAIALITDYIEQFYNRRRMHESLGYRTPEQFEKQYRGA
ncbi:MAG: IS3 family transposase [Burkholderiales bacterium]|nr:IS3 family transposase [Nitrosomonadaceae bacterium]